MLQLKQLPDTDVLSRFAERYPQVEVDNVLRFLTVLQVGTDLATALNHYLAGFNLLQSRWWILVLLMREPDLSATPSQLAEKAGVSRPTMTGLLDGLLKEKLIARLHVKHDRRQMKIHLTAKGQTKLDVIMPGYYQRVNALFSGLSECDSELMTESLKQLHQQRSVFYS